MNFLDLCQQLRADCAIQGDGPASVTNQVGMLAKLVTWIRESFLEIQNGPQAWDWMRETVRLPITVGVIDYPLAGWARPDIRFFDPEHAVLIRTGTTFTRIRPMSFDEFQTRYPVVDANPSTPSALTMMPSHVVRLNATPSEAFTLQATVRLAPQILAANGDVPRMPTEFHSVIVHKAKMKYALHDGDPSLYQGARSDYADQFRDLVFATTPTIQYRAVPMVR